MNRIYRLTMTAAWLAAAITATAAHAAEPQDDDATEVDLPATASAAGVSAATPAATPASQPAGHLVELPAGLGDFCFFAHLPPADQKYEVVKKLKVGKGTYGGVNDILPKLAENARTRGADAIIEYGGSQRFGFWPWRMVRPVVRGVAVKWTEPKSVDCEAIGGTKLSTILTTNQAPEK
ncbi:hypothetical protein [Paraburkholderia rhizosphaerae]|uniref:Uncharacterized protein n=1 Tax=Paraburkholderia rhizosphaerae TaxID=480658 RepID=A0A4R8LFZ3_9BURK|nr:hypothetical protein [Paraburkholderia rhizosphaerae]TDY42023.1 hypothetical protein BX592_1239 [Paraburkholderia rhizosphaerae]